MLSRNICSLEIHNCCKCLDCGKVAMYFFPAIPTGVGLNNLIRNNLME